MIVRAPTASGKGIFGTRGAKLWGSAEKPGNALIFCEELSWTELTPAVTAVVYAGILGGETSATRGSASYAFTSTSVLLATYISLDTEQAARNVNRRNDVAC
jgi:hypothetical protein